MSFAGEAYSLMMSDVSSAAVDQLVSRFGLWVRNSVIHVTVPFVGAIVHLHWPECRGALGVALACYLLLQVVQMWSPGPLLWLAMDGIWDVLCAGVGICLAWWLAMRSPMEAQS